MKDSIIILCGGGPAPGMNSVSMSVAKTFLSKGYRVIGDLSVTDSIMNNTFWIGVYPGMTDEMIDYMAKTIIEAVNL